MKKTKKKTNKNQDAQKKQSSHKVNGVSREAGRKYIVGTICGSGIGFEPGVK